MGIIDGLVVLAVLFGFGYLIFSRVTKNDPSKAQKIKDFFKQDTFYTQVKPQKITPTGLDDKPLM